MRSYWTFSGNDKDFDELARETPSDYAELYYAHEGQVANKWHHYLDIYDRTLGRYRGTPVRFLELGVRFGGSLQLWRKFLGPDAIIHGLDIDPKSAIADTPDHKVHIGSQTDTGLLQSIIDEMGGVDIVLDDASHVNEHQIETFEFLYDKISPDGLYIVEDTHTSYLPGYGGGAYRNRLYSPERTNFIEYAKRYIDYMHAWYRPGLFSEREHELCAITKNVSFHDSIVVFEKGEIARPFHTHVGTERFESVTAEDEGKADS